MPRVIFGTIGLPAIDFPKDTSLIALSVHVVLCILIRLAKSNSENLTTKSFYLLFLCHEVLKSECHAVI